MASAKGADGDLSPVPKADIAAVRSFLPGKLLGRVSALLSLVAVTLAAAGKVDQKLQALGVDLKPTPWLHYGLLFGLPIAVIAAQAIVEWQTARRRKMLKALAITPRAVQAG